MNVSRLPPETPPDGDGVGDDDRWLAIGLGAFLLIDGVVIATICHAAGMSPGNIALLLALIVAAILLALAAVTWLLWMPTQKRYPAQPIEVGAFSRGWQSFCFGLMGRFNHCLRLTADAQHLHIHPFILFTWCGARRISLPWSRITDVKITRAPLALSWAKIDGRRIAGPRWCMELAAGDAETTDDPRRKHCS